MEENPLNKRQKLIEEPPSYKGLNAASKMDFDGLIEAWECSDGNFFHARLRGDESSGNDGSESKGDQNAKFHGCPPGETGEGESQSGP